MSTRVFSIAGFTSENVGKGQPVSYSEQMPSGCISFPSSSNSTVIILYVGKASVGDAAAQPSAPNACVAAPALDVEGEAPTPLSLTFDLESEGSEGTAPAQPYPAFHSEGAFPSPCQGEGAEGDATPQPFPALDCEIELMFPRVGEDGEGAVPVLPCESEDGESPNARKDWESVESEGVEGFAPSPPRRCI